MKRNVKILCLKELLKYNLEIPIYQRPYEWTRHNVLTLLDDIYCEYKKNNPINLGSIILYNNKKENKYDIVDGQQRIITLAIMYYVLDIDKDIRVLSSTIQCTADTEKYIKSNKKEIEFFIGILEKDKDNFNINEFKRYIKKNINFYVIISNDLNEVFQLFDGRNSKYKSLDAIDLLKAYHLGLIKDNELKKALTIWDENINGKLDIDKTKNKIQFLFNDILFNIYNWSLNKYRRDFTKDDIYLYKGYSNSYNYNYVNYYKSNNSSLYLINKPFKEGIDFFEMIKLYIEEYENIIKHYNLYSKVTEDTKVEGYDEEDFNNQFQFINVIYYDALFMFKNRFGHIDSFEMDILKDYIYKWSLKHRIDRNAVRYDTVNKYIIKNSNFFFKCSNALNINELYKLPLIEIKKMQAGSNDNSKLSEVRRKLWKM